MNEFGRESRYLVIKRSDISKYLNSNEAGLLDEIGNKVARCRMLDCRDVFQCLVVESDWPEYEPTWDAIQRRMEGSPTQEEEAKAQGRAEGIKEAATVCDAHVLRTSDKWEARSQAQGNAVAHDCAAAIRALSSPPPDTETAGVCEWTVLQPAHDKFFDTNCGTQINVQYMHTNGFTHCPYCGKPISVKR